MYLCSHGENQELCFKQSVGCRCKFAIMERKSHYSRVNHSTEVSSLEENTHWVVQWAWKWLKLQQNASMLGLVAVRGKTLWCSWTLSWLNFSKNLPSSLLLQFAAESCCDIKAEGGAAERDMTAVCPFTLLYSISSSTGCAFNLSHLLSHAAWTERRKHKCHLNKNLRRISTLGKQGTRGA